MVKFSIYLNRCVFIMVVKKCPLCCYGNQIAPLSAGGGGGRAGGGGGVGGGRGGEAGRGVKGRERFVKK